MVVAMPSRRRAVSSSSGKAAMVNSDTVVANRNRQLPDDLQDPIHSSNPIELKSVIRTGSSPEILSVRSPTKLELATKR